MKAIKTISLLALALAMACDEPVEEPENVTTETEESEVEEEPAPTIDLASIASRIGGMRMVVGQFGVELRPEAQGVIKAYVSNADGAPVQDAELEVEMQGADNQPHSVTLAWDASAAAYVGTMTDTTPAPGSATVKVTPAGGETIEAEADAVAVAPTPVYGGHVVLVGDIAAEVRPEADGVLYVAAKQGDAYLGADANVDLKVSVATEAGDPVEVPVVWDEPAAGYVAVLPEGATIANGNLSLVATIDGQEHVSGIADVSVTAPAHEGDVVAVGDLSVELVPGDGGQLEAYVTGPNGDAAAGADVQIEVAGVDTPVVLAWDEASSSYKGEIAADVDVSTAPVQVVVEHEGRARRGGIAVAAGRRLGVAWRSRVESGEGGAIPPGQQMRLAANTEIRGRHGGTAVAEAGGDVEVDVSGAAAAAGMARAEAAMVRAEANMAAAGARAAANRARAAAVNARGQAERARGAAAMAAAMTRAPSVMVSAGAGGSAMGGMGSASVMVGL